MAEPLVAVVAAGTFVFLFEWFTDGPMAGPGAIGLLFIGVGLGLLVFDAVVVRTLVEYYEPSGPHGEHFPHRKSRPTGRRCRC